MLPFHSRGNRVSDTPGWPKRVHADPSPHRWSQDTWGHPTVRVATATCPALRERRLPCSLSLRLPTGEAKGDASQWGQLHRRGGGTVAASEGAGPGNTSPGTVNHTPCPRTPQLRQVSSKISGTEEWGPLSFLINFPHPSEVRNHSSFVSLGLRSREKADNSFQTLISCRLAHMC